MKYYPVFLNIRDRLCVVIGGGKVAERKVLSLLEAGARVNVISPEITPTLKALVQEGRVTHYGRLYQSGDIRDAFIAYTTIGDREVNERIAQEACINGTMLNIADIPDKCDFIVPSIVRREDLIIAVSTSGNSPAMAKMIREELETSYGWEYGVFLNLMGAIRARLLTKGQDSSYNKSLFLKLVSSPLLKFIREGKEKEVDKILKEVLDEGFSLSKLKVSIVTDR
ncbi:MAG: bifunctional precorrin-2 dehydrogenase/sirohydrochlorin ferrochelatase [Thermodesulfobacteriota bacterium]